MMMSPPGDNFVSAKFMGSTVDQYGHMLLSKYSKKTPSATQQMQILVACAGEKQVLESLASSLASIEIGTWICRSVGMDGMVALK